VTIIYKGLSPHDLGPAESASARSIDGSVEVTLHVLDDWHSPTLLAIRVRMPATVARARRSIGARRGRRRENPALGQSPVRHARLHTHSAAMRFVLI
jgi:hypothetical protein